MPEQPDRKTQTVRRQRKGGIHLQKMRNEVPRHLYNDSKHMPRWRKTSACFISENRKMKKITLKDLEKYEGKYDRTLAFKLLKKLRKATRKKPKLLSKPVGTVVECLGHFLSAIDNPALPIAEKAKVIGAIAYIVSPIDLIPDAIPIVGFSDDAGAALLLVKHIISFSTFSLQELDNEIDGISAEPLSETDDTLALPAEIQKQIESVEKQAAEDPVTAEHFSSETTPFNVLEERLKKGNELFQQFLDKKSELDNEFFENQKTGKKLSDDMWNAISSL